MFSLTLHDRLITLPVADIPDKIMNTPLFSYLADHGILKVLQWDIMNDFEREASNELEVLFEEKVTEKEVSQYLNREDYGLYLHQHETKSDLQRSKFIDQIIAISKIGIVHFHLSFMNKTNVLFVLEQLFIGKFLEH